MGSVVAVLCCYPLPRCHSRDTHQSGSGMSVSTELALTVTRFRAALRLPLVRINLFDRFLGNAPTPLSIIASAAAAEGVHYNIRIQLSSERTAQLKDMDDRGHVGAEANRGDVNDNGARFKLDSPTLKPDHCDLLLDAIDAQLVELQVHVADHDCTNTVPLRWSQSVSKDTGLGSTTQTNDTPMSCLELVHSPVEQTSESSTRHQETPAIREDPEQKLTARRTGNKEEMESHREQVIWRLKRLLGDDCKEGTAAGETQRLSDSICTEDFVKHFRDEMVEVPMVEGSEQQPIRGKGAQRTVASDSDTSQEEPKGQRLPYVARRGTEKGLCDGSDAKMVPLREKLRSGERCPRPQKHSDKDDIFHRSESVKEEAPIYTSSPKTRCLAGVPMLSFDTVSIDSDLDSICTEQVREHIHRQPGWRNILHSVRKMDELCNNQTDDETTTQEEGEPQSTSVQRGGVKAVQKRSIPPQKTQHKRKESHRRLCYLSDDNKDTDEDIKGSNRRLRSGKSLERMQSDQETQRERHSALRQKRQEGEETLCLHKSQLNEVELSVSEVQERKQHALQELEQLTTEIAQMEQERTSLECVLRERRAEKDSVCCELQKLQRQRESDVYEARNKEVELKSKQRPNVVMSVLEREEMERQLDNAKSELFAEQRRARERMESMEEKLEESSEALQNAKESESSLRNKCISLEEARKCIKQQLENAEYHVIELQEELRESKTRVGSLETMLAQRELQLLENQQQRSSYQVHRDELKGELQCLKAHHSNALKEAQEQASKATEIVLKQQKEDLALGHEMRIQKINKQAEEEKAKALKEQALSFAKRIESLQNSIQLKEEEANNLKMCLEKKEEEAVKREEEMCREVLHKVHRAVEEEKRRREAEKADAAQVHCGIVEEQNRKGLEYMRSTMQQEKSKGLALQCKVVDLQTRVQELEADSCALQTEHKSMLAMICKTLKEEHEAELLRMKRHMAQESQRTVMRLEKAVQIAEKESDRLRAMLEEKERSQSEATADVDQQLRLWIQELLTECKHLHHLVDQGGDKSSTGQLPSSSTVADALTALRTTREQLKNVIGRLHQELSSQKQTTEELSKDKERELSIQRHHLRMERDQALDSLKERLIQEHIEELSSLKWAHICDGGSERVAESLRKQLNAKDLELRQVQRSMSQWKEQTAARLACKFEEELTAELERNTSKTQDEELKRPEVMTHGAKETPILFGAPRSHAVDSGAANSPSDTASLKLLRYLQSRVKQLRVENQTSPWSPSPSTTDSSRSYVNTASELRTGV